MFSVKSYRIDHFTIFYGLDNLNHHCLSMVVTSTMASFVFETPLMRFLMILSLQINVIALHTFKLIKGELEFPYYVDASHMIISIVFFSFGWFGLKSCFAWKIFGLIGLKEIVIFIGLISTNLSTFELFYKATRVDSTMRYIRFFKFYVCLLSLAPMAWI